MSLEMNATNSAKTDLTLENLSNGGSNKGISDINSKF